MKSLTMLWQEILREEGSRCSTSTTRDFDTVTRRVEKEGLSFLTITLPAFCKDFERSLDRGFVANDLFTGFRFSGGLPAFLRGFLSLIFNPASGLLLDTPSIDAVRAVRQLTLMFGKIGLPCSDARERKAMAGYVATDKMVDQLEHTLDPNDLRAFHDMAQLLFRDVFAQMDREVYEGNIVPKHGPGSTAERLFANAKFNQTEWPLRLEPLFPALENIVPNSRYHETLESVTFLDPGAERPVRVISVPKTLKTPRIIAIEPTAMQYMQQGLLELLVPRLIADPVCGELLGFDDQVPNQELARRGSLHGDLATLDLSEASDRVSNLLVRTALSNFPHFDEAVQATRSTHADLSASGLGVIPLSKFASMGSALCFPMEAIVFTTVIFLGIQDASNKRLSRKDIQSFAGTVRVYGDDIIVPVDVVGAVIKRLEGFGFLVNASKSFWSGKFRESCGKEYYDGEDVTVVKVRTLIPSSRRNASEIISTVSMRNQFYFAGLWTTCRYLDRLLEKVLLGHYPTVGRESPVLGRHTHLDRSTRFRSYIFDEPVEYVSASLHCPLVKGWMQRTRIPESKLDDLGALLKFFLKRGGLPTADREHLERSGRPDLVDIKIGKATPF